MVAVTLFGGLVMLGGGFHTLAFRYHFLGSGVARFLLGYLPVLFATIYFLVSLLRLGIIKKKEAERLERNRKKKVMRAIFQQALWRATAEQIYFAMLSLGDKELKQTEVEGVLQKLVIDLGGDIDLGSQGEAIYTFDRLRREYEAAERLRGRELKG
jgi:hypothetical protein